MIVTLLKDWGKYTAGQKADVERILARRLCEQEMAKPFSIVEEAKKKAKPFSTVEEAQKKVKPHKRKFEKATTR